MNEVFNTSKAHGLIVCDVNLVVDRAMLNVITMIDILIKNVFNQESKIFYSEIIVCSHISTIFIFAKV